MWTYDTGGNITSRTEYNYTAGDLGEPINTVYYTYDDASWGDLMTSRDGHAAAYDGCGNLTAHVGWTYNWEGRQLESLSVAGTTWTFRYDSNGLRTEKSNGTKKLVKRKEFEEFLSQRLII